MPSQAVRSRRAPALPLRSRRLAGDGKGRAIVDRDVTLARKSSKAKGRRRTGKNADQKAINKRDSATAVAADTSVKAAVAKATNMIGKAAKAAAEKAVIAEKLTLEDADDYGKMDDVGPIKKRKRAATAAAAKDAKAAEKARKDASKAA